MKLFDTIAIVGMGLIGGSMAKDIKKQRLAHRVIGVSRHKKTLVFARNSGIIDNGSQDLSIVKDADLVILATPVNTILKLSQEIRKFVSRDCIVTDVGSTKKEIVSELSKIFPNYVGSHPLAGSEKRGVANVQPSLFKGSLCLLTPTKDTNPKALNKIKEFWRKLGARVAFLNPDTHDKILSFVSHLPHAVAFSLIATVPGKYLKFSANGLRDTTRIALSDERLWTDILLSNRKYMLESIESFQDTLSMVKSAIDNRDEKTLIRILKESKNKREILR